MKIEELKQFGIAPELIECMKNSGFSHLYSVQVEAIKRGSKGRNIVVTSPPGSGKTLIAEILGINQLLSSKKKKKCVWILPLKALAREKFVDLTQKYGKLGLTIEYSTGDTPLTQEAYEMADIVVLTFERWDSFLRSHPETQIGCLCVDEIHEVGSPHRGPRLEALLSRIRVMDEPPQIIGLSATIGNPESIARWLDAELIISRELHHLTYRLLISENKYGSILKILDKSLRENQQVLIFMGTRAETEKLAIRFSKEKKIHECISKTKIAQMIEYLSTQFLPKLEDPSLPTSSVLSRCAGRGIGFHHAGLAQEERIAVEEAFANGNILVLTATPTLASGLNLPASTVIIYDLKLWNGRYIDVNALHQRAGRAGRPILNREGTAILLVGTEDEFEHVENRYFMKKDNSEKLVPRYENIESSLTKMDALREQILARIVSVGGTATQEDIVKMFEKTLWASQLKEKGIAEHLEAFLFPTSPLYALRIRKTSAPGPILDFKILQKSPDRVMGLVKTEKWGQYTASFDIKHGAYCSCSKAAELLRRGRLCEHLSHLAYQILKEEPFYPAISRTLLEMSPFYFLKSHKLIEELEDNVYRATIEGQMGSKLYLMPLQIVFIRDLIFRRPIKTQRDALKAALRTLQLTNRIAAPVEDLLEVLDRWIEGVPYSKILDATSPIIYSGDLENLVNSVSWLLTAFSTLMDALGDQLARYSDEFRMLAKCIDEGLPERGVELKNQLGIPRGKTVALIDGGIRSFEELKAIPPNYLVRELRQLPGIGNKTISIIQKALAA